MPWTLYRYIFKELIRLLVLSTAALVLVIGFAVSIKPMMDGVLGPVGLVKLLMYTAPTVLGFAVPFSAAFSSTLVFCRMSSDNEVQACRAVGLSYGTVLLPAVMLGLVLTLLMYYLGNWVVPTFYKDAEGMVQQNLVDMIVTQVSRGDPVELPGSNMVIFANGVSKRASPLIAGAKAQPDEVIDFSGVAVGRLGPDGSLRDDTTAESAQVLVYHDENGDVWFEMLLQGVMHVEQGRFASSDQMQVVPERVPNLLKDRARFLSLPALKETLARPERQVLIQGLKDRLVAAMASRRLLELLNAGLIGTGHGRGRVTLQAQGDPGDHWVIESPVTDLRNREQELVLWPAGGVPVTVEHWPAGGRPVRFTMLKGLIRVSAKEGEPEVELDMAQVQSRAVGGTGPAAGLATDSIKGLVWHEPLATGLADQSALALLPVARRDFPNSQVVMSAAYVLAREIDQLGRRLIATAFQRDASAFSCLLVLVLGAVLSIKLKHALPLVIYFWVFLLAFIAIVITNSGEKLATGERPLVVALTAIWSGDLLLLGALALNYWKLTRT